ncbi:hypothetical protein [Haladaptatus sp.]|uniref:hypothetical protein n=1 Tax=Haladaptatus sp. TaxID=1973141 RepID=UPI003C68A555
MEVTTVQEQSSSRRAIVLYMYIVAFIDEYVLRKPAVYVTTSRTDDTVSPTNAD